MISRDFNILVSSSHKDTSVYELIISQFYPHIVHIPPLFDWTITSVPLNRWMNPSDRPWSHRLVLSFPSLPEVKTRMFFSSILTRTELDHSPTRLVIAFYHLHSSIHSLFGDVTVIRWSHPPCNVGTHLSTSLLRLEWTLPRFLFPV